MYIRRSYFDNCVRYFVFNFLSFVYILAPLKIDDFFFQLDYPQRLLIRKAKDVARIRKGINLHQNQSIQVYLLPRPHLQDLLSFWSLAVIVVDFTGIRIRLWQDQPWTLMIVTVFKIGDFLLTREPCQEFNFVQLKEGLVNKVLLLVMQVCQQRIGLFTYSKCIWL